MCGLRVCSYEKNQRQQTPVGAVPYNMNIYDCLRVVPLLVT